MEPWHRLSKLESSRFTLVDGWRTTIDLRDNDVQFNCKVNGTPKGVHLPISKLYSILAVANLLAFNNLWLCYYVQVNSLRLKSNREHWWATTFRGNAGGCCRTRWCNRLVNLGHHRKKLDELHVHKLVGPDHTHPRVLKGLQECLSVSFTDIFTRPMSTEAVPDEWRIGNVTRLVWDRWQ